MELKRILKINWFKYKWLKYNRDDWYLIEIIKKTLNSRTRYWYSIVSADWDEKHCWTKEEVIGYLVLQWIINRLF